VETSAKPDEAESELVDWLDMTPMTPNSIGIDWYLNELPGKKAKGLSILA
jgi:hypothetical protein